MNASFRNIPGAVLVGTVFLVLALLVAPAADLGWGELAGAWPGIGALAGVLILSLVPASTHAVSRLLQLALLLAALYGVVGLVDSSAISGSAGAGFWLLVVALGFAVWHVMQRFTTGEPKGPLSLALYRVLVPGIFGIWFLTLWELVTVGFGIPRVLLPPPSLVGDAITDSLSVLAADFQQTVVRAVIPGFVIGNLAGFTAALAADRWAFLGRGLLPVGNLVSAIPIIGIAPIMVMWFGFDWQSKAAVVVIMTFFPMLVNTISGLRSSGAMELDLMRSIGASHWQAFVRVRLPNALPFIFNALKINSALALIGAIVAEFFGTPIVGIGFRISTEVGRMNMEMVWASIALAAVSGSVFYGLLAVAERRATFWHPSFRRLS
ncbi:MAG: ABC transporter permease [Arenicellales bacterium]|nr:ABC transporter permease [Arenicellales bacterium]MDP6551307.1 ABC transporter permease [Arenicellales bacterium]MDP6791443.1 ABC transporter permease [Arenicellales bacterium]